MKTKRLTGMLAGLSGLIVLMVLLPAGVNRLTAGSPRYAALVASVSGETRAQFKGRARLIKPGDLLEAGTVLETAPRASARISLANECRVIVGGGTKVTVGPNGIAPYTAAVNGLNSLQKHQIWVYFGRIWVEVEKRLQGLLGFEVKSPAASIAVRGTRFFVLVEPNGFTEVLVSEGEVEVANAYGLVRIAPGYAAAVQKGSAPKAEPSQRKPETPPGQENDKGKPWNNADKEQDSNDKESENDKEDDVNDSSEDETPEKDDDANEDKDD